MVVSLPSGRMLKFTFCHSSHDSRTPEGAGTLRSQLDLQARRLNRRLSYAAIEEIFPVQADGDNGTLTLASAISVTHPNDTFSRAVGRKRAVAKALQAAFPSSATDPSLSVAEAMMNYDVRTVVWDKFKAEFGTSK